jgi:hypothetical protein
MPTNVPERKVPDSDYPALVASWVGETIPELEAGIFNGTLAELIERPDFQEVIGSTLTERYKTIASEKLKHDPIFRRNWIQKFIEVFQGLLQPPRKLFPARVAVGPKQKRAWSVGDGKPPSIVVSHYHGEVTLRPDQVLSARGWGNWFSFADEELDRFYMEYLINQARQSLAANIKNLWNIEATFLSGFSCLGPEATWTPERRGGLFEHLILDVLNELSPIARHAPLAEDILEQTDLRVQFLSVPQNPVTRMQVALISDPELHEQKVNALHEPSEFVILTPLELAMCAVHPPVTPSFGMLSRQGFWAPLGGRSSDVVQLANKLYQLFEETFALPTIHPLGPMWILPPTLRDFIRAFTEYRAAEAAKRVHEREEKIGQKVGLADKFTGPHWKAIFTQAPSKDELQKPKVIIPPKQQIPKPPKNVKNVSEVNPVSPKPEKKETPTLPNVSASIPLPSWKIIVHYNKGGKTHLKNLGRTLVEHGDPADWMIPGPIHKWLKDKLVEADISFSGIECVMVGRKDDMEQMDQLLEHLPLTQEEIESCR